MTDPLRVKIGRWAYLDRKGLTRAQERKLRRNLTVLPKPGHPSEKVRPIFLFEQGDRWFGVPREYYLQRRKAAHHVVFEDPVYEPFPTPLKFNPKFSLRESQQQAMRDVQRALGAVHPNGGPQALGGVVKAPTGWGKTVWGCALIAELGVPTLVVVHKDPLVDQWTEALGNFLPGVSIGRVQGPVLDYKGRHVAIGMIQSLSQKSYAEEFYRWPGLVITDECHRISAPTWSKVITQFHAKNRIGLTATPRRKDGTEKVFFSQIGPIIHSGEELRETPKVHRVYSEFYPLNKMALDNESKLLVEMVKNRARNRLIVAALLKSLDNDRVVIVGSKRRAHLDTLREMFNDVYPRYVLTSRAEMNDRLRRLVREARSGSEAAQAACIQEATRRGYPIPPQAKCMGGVSKAEIRRAKTDARVLWATVQYVGEGFNVPRLDTLILAAPVVDCEQVVGRILRPHPDKKKPLVIDVRDPRISMMEAYANLRDRIYRRLMS